MVRSLSLVPLAQLSLPAGQEHGRTIPLPDSGTKQRCHFSLRRSDVGEERTRCAQVGASEFARCHIHESRAEGIVTAEDATVALRYGVDGVLVSNHGGRSEESLRSSIE